eukprot:3443040-Prymnesium_polylepis.1
MRAGSEFEKLPVRKRARGPRAACVVPQSRLTARARTLLYCVVSDHTLDAALPDTLHVFRCLSSVEHLKSVVAVCASFALINHEPMDAR